MILHWNCPWHTNVYAVSPHKNRKLRFHVKYVYKHISVTKDPRIHNRRGLQVPWCVACNVAIGWNCWRAKVLCSFSRSLGLLCFFHGKRLETLPETNSGQAPETLGLPGWQVWTVRFRVFVGLRKVDGGNSMWLRWFNGWTWGWAGFVSVLLFSFVGTWVGHESYVDCLLTFLHVNNLLILLEQWCVHVFWSHSWV